MGDKDEPPPPPPPPGPGGPQVWREYNTPEGKPYWSDGATSVWEEPHDKGGSKALLRIGRYSLKVKNGQGVQRPFVYVPEGFDLTAQAQAQASTLAKQDRRIASGDNDDDDAAKEKKKENDPTKTQSSGATK